MPRDGTGVYTRPSPDVETGTEIESAVYNLYTADVATDLNAARPIVAGGTGATNADAALVALSGEKASQVVVNYSSHIWASGSFSAAGSATGGPVDGHAFSGSVIVTDNDNILLEARDVTDNKLYLRRKTAGAWGAWVDAAAADDARFVNVAGDTMTGNLVIDKTDPNIRLKKNAGGQAYISGDVGTNYRWVMELGNNVAEIGSNAGSNFAISGFSDTGVYINAGMTITRSNMTATFSGNLVGNSSVTAGATHATNGTYFFGNNGSKSFAYTSPNFGLTGGPLVVADRVYSALTSATGEFQFGTSGTKSLQYDGAQFYLNGGDFYHTGANFVASGQIWSRTSASTGFFQFGNTATRYLTYDGTNFSFNGAPLHVNGASIYAQGRAGRQGQLGGAYGSLHNWWWTGSVVQMWVDTTNLGNVSSDYRIKKDVLDLPGMWDTVKALRPIKYTHADFSTQSHKKFVAEEIIKARKEAEENPEAKPREVNTGPFFAGDDIERWGFIAHELQETLLPSAAKGVKDSPDTIQSPNSAPIVAALTKALQEAMARIEALEAR